MAGSPTFYLLFPLLFICVSGYMHFQALIPNGDKVPHPCKDRCTWNGVGHLTATGGGKLNSFGTDFKEAAKKWTQSLCYKDSDGDGKTNGEELGDPACVWRPGYNVTKQTGLSNPGFRDNDREICDKTVSDKCDDFRCPQLESDNEAREHIFRLPTIEIPAKETNYFCMKFEFEEDGDFHMIAAQPLINNSNIVHHIVLIGCTSDVIVDNKPWECNLFIPNCMNLIATWVPGKLGECFHKDIGMAIGNRGIKKFVVQIHYDNVEQKQGYVDSSGMIMHYTSNKRLYDAVNILFGQEFIQIPPNTEETIVESECSPYMMERFMSKNIFISKLFNHMHTFGTAMKIEHFRNGTKLRNLTYEENYDNLAFVTSEFDDPIEILQGDSIKTTCKYNTLGKSKTVFYGEGTYDEMCYGFVTVHPAQNLRAPACLSWKNIPIVDLYNGNEVKGCRHRDFLNIQHPDTMDIFERVTNSCDIISNCLSECVNVTQEIKRKPCFKGEINLWLRDKVKKDDMKEYIYFYSRLDSCDAEIYFRSARDRCAHEKCKGKNVINSGASTVSHFVTYSLVFLSIFASI